MPMFFIPRRSRRGADHPPVAGVPGPAGDCGIGVVDFVPGQRELVEQKAVKTRAGWRGLSAAGVGSSLVASCCG